MTIDIVAWHRALATAGIEIMEFELKGDELWVLVDTAIAEPVQLVVRASRRKSGTMPDRFGYTFNPLPTEPVSLIRYTASMTAIVNHLVKRATFVAFAHLAGFASGVP